MIKQYKITVASLETKANGGYSTHTVCGISLRDAIAKIPLTDFSVKEIIEHYEPLQTGGQHVSQND